MNPSQETPLHVTGSLLSHLGDGRTREMIPKLDFGALLSRHPDLRLEQDEYNINVTANQGQIISASEVLERFAGHDGAGRPTHLYFHLPLCSYICHFCNYVKQLLPSDGKEEETLDGWTDLLIDESQRYLDRAPWLCEARVESFYVGGGTAALLRARHLARLMGHVRDAYSLSPDCELTLEGNPDNFSNEAVRTALKLGFNRFSVGVQSMQDEVNRFTGRKHDSRASLRAIQVLAGTGYPYNVDLMFGLPFQTPESVRRDLQILVGLRVPTITIYRLRNVERHKMGIGNAAAWNSPRVRERLHREGYFPSLQQTYRMREEAVRVLLGHSYFPSPCGWWNAPDTYPDGNVPRVSRNKWQCYDTMVAFGPGAYGWLTSDGAEVIQTHNESDISAYVRRMSSAALPPLAFGRHLRGFQALASALGFAFKANQPIEMERFRRQFGVELLADSPCREVVGDLLRKGLLEICDGGAALRPTLDGEALHEEIISVYFHGRVGGFSAPVCQKFG